MAQDFLLTARQHATQGLLPVDVAMGQKGRFAFSLGPASGRQPNADKQLRHL
jgi:hypothetical protein